MFNASVGSENINGRGFSRFRNRVRELRGGNGAQDETDVPGLFSKLYLIHEN